MITNETTITVGAIALVITLSIQIYNFFQARFKEAKQKGEEKGIVVTKLDEIMKKLETLTLSNERLNQTLHDMSHMVEDHEKRIKVLEKRRAKKEEVAE